MKSDIRPRWTFPLMLLLANAFSVANVHSAEPSNPIIVLAYFDDLGMGDPRKQSREN